jgi:hypothetical protein
MAAPCFVAWAADTSAATGPPASVASSATSGTAKTILQIKAPTVQGIRIIEWGYGLSAAPAAPLQVELVDTGTVAATVTTIGSGIRAYNGLQTTSNCQTGTSATGFNASAEGSITASRLFAYHYESGLYFVEQFPLGREPDIPAGDILRIRVTPTSSAAVNLQCYIVWEE